MNEREKGFWIGLSTGIGAILLILSILATNVTVTTNVNCKDSLYYANQIDSLKNEIGIQEGIIVRQSMDQAMDDKIIMEALFGTEEMRKQLMIRYKDIDYD